MGSPTRARRLRAPLRLWLAALLLIEAAGGFVIFFARTAFGTTPGLTPHVGAGVVLTVVYAVYQWRHWREVRPWRSRLDYGLGLLAALSLVVTQATGFALAVAWWRGRHAAAILSSPYDATLTAVHNIGSMLVMTFVGAHFGAVVQRDRSGRRSA